MPWKSPMRRPKAVRSRAYLIASSNAPSARPSETLGLRQRCVLKADSSLLEAVLPQDHVLERQLAVLELDLGQVLAAHRVIACR